MTSPIELTTSQHFDIERLSRVIDATADPGELRLLAKQLLEAWHTEKAATHWLINQEMDTPFHLRGQGDFPGPSDASAARP